MDLTPLLPNEYQKKPSGAGNYRVVTDNPMNFDNGNQFTFSFWVKRDPGPTGTNPRFLSTVNLQSWVAWTPGRGVGFLAPAASSEPQNNIWHHFVVTYDRLAGSYSLYVDAVRQVSNASGYARNDPTSPAAQYWFIGHSETTATTTDSFTGLLDEVRIYNRFLNYNDIQALYLSGGQPRLSVSATSASITLSWPMGALGLIYTAPIQWPALPGIKLASHQRSLPMGQPKASLSLLPQPTSFTACRNPEAALCSCV